MSGPIRAGDLVLVLRNHCSDRYVGHVYSVLRVINSASYCGTCLVEMPPQQIAVLDGFRRGAGLPLPYLKRLPPLGELERDEIVRELTA